MNNYDMAKVCSLLGEVSQERTQQYLKFGDQSGLSADRFYVILMEEVGEVARAILEGNPTNYREELIQVAAMAIQMIDALDRSLAS